MGNEFNVFIRVLEKSVEKYGPDKTLTLGHLSNIAKLAKKIHNDKLDLDERRMQAGLDEIWNDMHKYGSD